MYLRFATSTKIDGSTAREGFFGAAYELKEQSATDPHALRQLEDLLAWFRQNLSIPPRFNRSKSKGFYRRTATQGISWFKPTAKEHLAKGFELATLLVGNGYPIEVLKSTNPGYVVYEDEYQLVAEPFSDTIS